MVLYPGITITTQENWDYLHNNLKDSTFKSLCGHRQIGNLLSCQNLSLFSFLFLCCIQFLSWQRQFKRINKTFHSTPLNFVMRSGQETNPIKELLFALMSVYGKYCFKIIIIIFPVPSPKSGFIVKLEYMVMNH